MHIIGSPNDQKWNAKFWPSLGEAAHAAHHSNEEQVALKKALAKAGKICLVISLLWNFVMSSIPWFKQSCKPYFVCFVSPMARTTLSLRRKQFFFPSFQALWLSWISGAWYLRVWTNISTGKLCPVVLLHESIAVFSFWWWRNQTMSENFWPKIFAGNCCMIIPKDIHIPMLVCFQGPASLQSRQHTLRCRMVGC